VSVAIVIQHVIRKRRIILSSVGCLALSYFSTFSQTAWFSEKKFLNIKRVFWWEPYCFMRADGRTDGQTDTQTDRHDEANSRFLYCDRALKKAVLQNSHILIFWNGKADAAYYKYQATYIRTYCKYHATYIRTYYKYHATYTRTYYKYHATYIRTYYKYHVTTSRTYYKYHAICIRTYLPYGTLRLSPY
jgi:hypothetical protein